MTERRRGGLGRGLGALIPTARADGDAPEVRSRRDPAADHALALVGGRGTALTSADVAQDDEVETATDGDPDTSEFGTPVPAAVDAPGVDAADPLEAAHPIESATNMGVAAAPGAGPPGAELADVAARYAELDPASIRPNPRQPRVVFDEDALAELVHSIREIGVLQPVVVRELSADDDGQYELVMGERRWRAAREAGLATIPAIIRDTPDTALLRDALLENLHRSQLNPLEEAAAYDQLLQDFGCTQDQLAERIGRSRPQISNTLRLLKLPPSVQRRLAAGVLSAGHARALLGLAEAAAQERLAQRVVAEGLSVRSVEEIVAVGPADGPARTGAGRLRRPVTANQTELEQRLSDRFDTRVRIERGRLKGKIVIEFASTADLDRIVAVIEADATTAEPITRSA